MARKSSDTQDFGIVDDRQRGYEAARQGIVSYRHNRYWIDDASGAELCRPEVVKGIVNYYQDADARDQADTYASIRADMYGA